MSTDFNMAQMNKNTIFCKTADGEEAVKQRTRLVQRNLRNILIMVDGQSSVADLAEHFGDMAVVLGALAELLALGFIVGEKTAPAPPTPPSPPTPSAPAPTAEPSANEEQEAWEAWEEQPLIINRDESTEMPTPPEIVSIAAPIKPDLPPPPPPPPPVVSQPQPLIEEIFFESPEYFSDPAPARPAARPAADMRNFFERNVETKRIGASLVEAVKDVWSQQSKRNRSDHYDVNEPVRGGIKTRPLRRRGKRLYISWPLMAVMIVGGAISIVALVALLFPYDNYLPDIEKRASVALNDPVKIGKISFSFLPRPNITLRGVVIGKERFLSVDTVRVLPDFISLLTDKKVLRELELDNLLLKHQGLAHVSQWSSGPNVEVRRIHVSGLRLDLGDVVLDAMGGDVAMSAQGPLEKIELRNADANFKLKLTPKGQGFNFEAIGSAWKMPVQPGLTFEYLEAQGELGATRLDITKLDGKLYGGLLVGRAVIDWSRGAELAGDSELKRIDLAKLLPTLNPDLEAEGELSGKTRFEGRSDSLANLGESVRVEGNLDIKRGVVKRFDIIEAVRNGHNEPTRGGLTRFEQLTGNLLQEKKGWKLTNLRASSGLMKAGGSVGMDRDARLSGNLDVEMKGSASVVRAKLALTGTLKEPVLTPTRGTKK